MSCGNYPPSFDGPDKVTEFNNYLAYVSTLRGRDECCKGPLKQEVQKQNMCDPDYLVAQLKEKPENAGAVLQLANYCTVSGLSKKVVNTDSFQVKDACNVLMYANPEMLSSSGFSPCGENSYVVGETGFLRSGIPPSSIDRNTCTIQTCSWLSDPERESSGCESVVDKMVSFDQSMSPKEYAEQICSNSFEGSNCVQVFTEALTNLQQSSKKCCTTKIPAGKSMIIQIAIIVVAVVLLALFIWLVAALIQKISVSSQKETAIVQVSE